MKIARAILLGFLIVAGGYWVAPRIGASPEDWGMVCQPPGQHEIGASMSQFSLPFLLTFTRLQYLGCLLLSGDSLVRFPGLTSRSVRRPLVELRRRPWENNKPWSCGDLKGPEV